MNSILNSQGVYKNLKTLRQRTPPLVHNITNFVTMDMVANSLLAIGASPIMAHAEEEVEEIVKLSNSLVINIGTLTPEWFKSMSKALETAHFCKLPVVLDPVGAGATTYRTDSCKILLDKGGISVVRGNASEIHALSTNNKTTKGVDSTESPLKIKEAAHNFAKEKNLTVVASGEVDVVSDGINIYEIENGSSLMGKVTGMGCVASSVIGAFLAIGESPLSAAVTTMSLVGIAGEVAAMRASHIGSFKVAFLDALYTLSETDISSRLRITHC